MVHMLKWINYICLLKGIPKHKSFLYELASSCPPQVYLYSREGEHTLAWTPGCNRKAPILAPLLVGAAVTRLTDIGTSTLMVTDKNFREVSKQVNQD